MNIFVERILPLFEQSGMNDQELERNIDLPRGIIYDWKKGRTKSYKKYCGQIASYFHVSTDYLLGNTDDPRPTGPRDELPMPESESRPPYPPEYDLLTPEDKVLVDNMIRSLAKKKSSP